MWRRWGQPSSCGQGSSLIKNFVLFLHRLLTLIDNTIEQTKKLSSYVVSVQPLTHSTTLTIHSARNVPPMTISLLILLDWQRYCHGGYISGRSYRHYVYEKVEYYSYIDSRRKKNTIFVREEPRSTIEGRGEKRSENGVVVGNTQLIRQYVNISFCYPLLFHDHGASSGDDDDRL